MLSPKCTLYAGSTYANDSGGKSTKDGTTSHYSTVDGPHTLTACALGHLTALTKRRGEDARPSEAKQAKLNNAP